MDSQMPPTTSLPTRETKLRKPKVIRVTGFTTSDRDQAKRTLRTVLRAQIPPDDNETLPKQYAISIVPSCDESCSYNALVDFKPGLSLPGKLAKLQGAQPASIVLTVNDGHNEESSDEPSEHLKLDNHFHGFTQMFPTKDSEPVTADVIAITGLDGHAYGSWTSKDEPWFMWLRHFLKKDLPNCRTMTYGYDSKLSSRGVNTIMDYGRELFQNLRRIRHNKVLWERPLIFIAHSFGGIILAHSLVKSLQAAENDQAICSLLKSTYGILFFGTPHSGLLVDDLQRMVEASEQDQHPRQNLLQQINSMSDRLTDQLADFKNLVRDRKIVSFYEMLQTRQLEKNLDTGSWHRTGAYVTTVDSGSALLNLSDSEEAKIPVNADHSQIVKFDSRYSETYQQAVRYLQRFQSEAGKAIFTKFKSDYKTPEMASFSTVPFERDIRFVERQDIEGQDIIDQLDLRLSRDSSHTRVALVGLGGVGKSQVAIEYSYRLRAKTPELKVFWVYAVNPARFEQSFRTIATQLELPGHDDSKIDILNLVSRWLGNTKNGKWLIILDNADDVAVLRHTQDHGDKFNISGLWLMDYIPRASNGSLLVTTRDRRAAYELCGTSENMIQIGPMSKDEATQLLQSRLPAQIDQERMQELVECLDFIPLAISQAAAYISIGATRMTISKYLELYQQDEASQSQLLDKEFGDLRRDSSVPNSVFKTWQISFNQIKDSNSSASGLLALMAVLDRQGIPDFLLEMFFENKVDFEDSLSSLLAFSFIACEKGKETLEMHRLVQLSTRNWLKFSGQLDKYHHDAIDILSRTFPSRPYENWEISETLVPHAIEVMQAGSSTGEGLARARLLHSMSRYYTSKGQYKYADEAIQESLSLQKSQMTQDYPDILATQSSRAEILYHRGQYEEAEKMEKEVLEAHIELLGLKHPNTLTSMSNLTLAYSQRGQYDKAEKMGNEVLEARIELLGPKHPDTLTSMEILTSTYMGQGQYDKAGKMGKEVLEGRIELLGLKHPHTLASMSSLALTYMDQGQYDKAEKMGKEVLEAHIELLGPKHPDTLTSMSNLALIYMYQGQYDKAEKMGKEGLEGRIELLGLKHPHTLASMSILALTYLDQGQYDKAEKMGNEVLEGRIELLGPKHSGTLTSMGNLTLTYMGQGQYDKAEKMGMEVLEARIELLGLKHPGTLTSMNNLAWSHKFQGRDPEAIRLMTLCAELSADALGTAHPQTKRYLAHLNAWKASSSKMRRPRFRNPGWQLQLEDGRLMAGRQRLQHNGWRRRQVQRGVKVSMPWRSRMMQKLFP